MLRAALVAAKRAPVRAFRPLVPTASSSHTAVIMTSTDVFAAPVTVSRRVRSMDVPACLALASESMDAIEASDAFQAYHKSDAKLNGLGVAAMLDGKEGGVFAGPPLDRGPAPAGPDLKMLKSWQYQVTGKAAAAAVLQEVKAVHIKHGGPVGIAAEATKYIREHKLDETFYVVDLANVHRMFKAWRAAMPRVMPYYAVKCHPEPGLLRLLVALGAGFDCASKGELATMLGLGVPPSRIIFAHPCKRPCDIRYARDHGVEYTTFDTESELHKIASLHPGFRCVLRIRADDPEARVPLGLKYGCELAEAHRLLGVARDLGLSVVGVSFHVGSACKNLATFTTAIEKAREIFDAAEAHGFDMELLDIGGGFSGRFDAHGHVMFGDIAATINAALAAHFPPESGVRVISEPGRYLAETSCTLLTPVVGQREVAAAGGAPGARTREYWLTDGLYGSFNCILYDGQNPGYRVLRSPLLPEVPAALDAAAHNSTLWGPTCDSADCVYKDVPLPALRNGDWLAWPNAGAYTVAGACDFNGIEFTSPSKFYVYSDCAVDGEEGEAGEGEEAAEGGAAAEAADGAGAP